MTTARLALFVRVLIALFTRTFFQPDEYFQSLEPAYNAVFGHAHLTWEWLAPRPIRSIIYPALNIPIYYALKVSSLSEIPWVGDLLLIYSPRILHGALAALTDIWLCNIVQRWLGHRYVSPALLLSLSSLFHALSLSRSLSNSLETSLTTIAFASFPWDASSDMSSQLIYNRDRMKTVVLFSAMACMVRPTNAVIWIYLFGRILWALRSSKRALNALLVQLVTTGPTFTPFNFFYTNFSSVSLFYGSNVWHYYLSQALPLLCTTALPFVLHGMWLALTDKHATALRNMFMTVIWTISVYSLAGHKEWRFIHPILPLLHVFAAKSLVDLSAHVSKHKKGKVPNKGVSFIERVAENLRHIRKRFLAIIILTIPVSIYVVLFYCSAPVSVLAYIRSLSPTQLDGGVGFMMPCHSTPGHAYLHRKELAHGKLWALGCEPPLQGQNLSTYRDQTDVFFSSPIEYIQTRFPSHVRPTFPASPVPTSIPGAPQIDNEYPWKHEWPRYLVFFGALLETEGIAELLEAKGYRQVWKRGREWEGEGQRKGGVRVWEWHEA
ncbi:hypothetical protein H0H93_012262 [Arthromyces matolae]|nr:hypothetical protein H0H93_012262 [Arthromyces matolae]